MPLLFCSYGVDSQSSRGRFVIEPPEVGAALAGMSITSGAAEARRESPTAGGEIDDDRRSDAGRWTESSGSGRKQEEGGDSVIVHASDGGLSPSPVTRRGRPRARSTSSSDSSSSRGGRRRGQRVASTVIKIGDVQAALAAIEASPVKDAGAVEGRQSGGRAVVGSPGRGPSEDKEEHEDERRDDRRLVVEEARDERAPLKQKKKRGSRGGAAKRHRKMAADQSRVGLHESEAMVRENLARSPHYMEYIPMFSPPPPFPGYVSRGGYVPAAAAGSSSSLARDAHYGASHGLHHEGRLGYEVGRARSRGRSVASQGGDERARSPAEGHMRSRGRSVARRSDDRERTPLDNRARSRGRSVARRPEDRARTPQETRARSRGRSVARRPEGDRACSCGRSVGSQQGARHQGASDQRRRRSRSRSRSRR
jgi:hypothetical protein